MKQKDVLFILVSACIVVLAWIIFNVYHQSITSKITESTNQSIQPINASFDKDTLKALKERTHIEPVYTAPSTTPGTELVTRVKASPSAVLTNISGQEASQGGNLIQ